MLRPLITPSEIATGLMAVATIIETSGVDSGLITLARLSAPQISNCAYLIRTHLWDALKRSEVTIDSIMPALRTPSPVHRPLHAKAA